MTFFINSLFSSSGSSICFIWSNSLKICPKIAQIEVFGHFLDFALLVFLDFAHNDRWAWCLVVFLQIAVQSMYSCWRRIPTVAWGSYSRCRVVNEFESKFLKYIYKETSILCYELYWHYILITCRQFRLF